MILWIDVIEPGPVGFAQADIQMSKGVMESDGRTIANERVMVRPPATIRANSPVGHAAAV